MKTIQEGMMLRQVTTKTTAAVVLPKNLWLAILIMLQFHATGSVGWSAEWLDLSSTAPKIIPPRSGHTSFVVSNDVFVFGGYVEEETSKDETPRRYPTNELWKWDPINGGWEDLMLDHTNNRIQPRIAAAAAVLFDDQPFVFGGWDPSARSEDSPGSEFLTDILPFDVGQRKFDLSLGVELDQPTSRHVAVTISDHAILLHTHRCNNFVWLFEGTNDKSKAPQLRQQPVTGDAPSPRGLHAACKLPTKNKLIVFGGAAQNGEMSNEVFSLDLDTWRWTTVNTNNDPCPSPRASPCLCSVDDDTVVVFGGAERTTEGGLHGCDDLWILEFDSDDCCGATWNLIEGTCGGKAWKPPGRNAATMNRISRPPSGVQVSSPEDCLFVLCGGWAPFQVTYNDNIMLRLRNENSA